MSNKDKNEDILDDLLEIFLWTIAFGLTSLGIVVMIGVLQWRASEAEIIELTAYGIILTTFVAGIVFEFILAVIKVKEFVKIRLK